MLEIGHRIIEPVQVTSGASQAQLGRAAVRDLTGAADEVMTAVDRQPIVQQRDVVA